MSSDSLKKEPTTILQKKNRLNHFTLAVVVIGSLVALWAVYYRFLIDGVFATTIFFAAIIALLAAIPLFKESRNMQVALNKN